MRWSVELRVDRPRDVGRQRRAPASNSSGSSQGLQGSSIPRWPGLGILGPSAAGSRTPGWRRSSVPASSVPASSVPTSSIPDPSVLGSSVPGSRVPGARILGSRLPGLWSSSISGLQHAATRALGVPGLSAASVRLRPLLALSPVSSQGQQTRLALTRHTSSLMLDSIPDVFSLKVLLEESGELFRIPSCRSDMTVRELKEQLDLVAGIPFNLQRLQYLDQGILMDESTLKYHDVDPGGVISLCIWQYDNWTELVLAAVEGDPSKLSCLGVSSEDSSAQTAQMQQLGPEAWRRWVEQRAFVALYITSHRGHLSAVKYLLEHGANCLGSTPLGRTALHVAAAMDRPKCILALLKHGASISQKDRYGETPMSLAHKLTQSSVQRRLFLSYWMTKCRALDSKSPDGQKAQPKATPKNRT
ncbi:ankyrin repeat domain-containing protein 60 [Sorex fumeus]|uniref:ankyrin repeat domain-containing protein 60 n=1 Tax=Sorex fumeus TaxID=62283 RepID=UPI0024AD9B98|nr:ankyrin repeat domain-containing protein 60 [Sorex fumeus]